MSNISILFDTFRTYLDDFADLVADKEYEKMSYKMWRILSKSRDTHSQVCLTRDEHGVDVIFDGEMEFHHFVFGDNSFGDFLLENVLPQTPTTPKEGLTMNYSCWDEDNDPFPYERVRSHIPWYDKEDDPFDVRPQERYGFNRNDFYEERPAPSITTPTPKKKNTTETNTTEKENSTMKGFNFDFGPVNSNVARMSIYGLAVKNKAGTWVSYDAKNEEIMDVDVFNFDGAKFLYKMPVAIKDVAIGDVIVHMNVPMFVVGKSEDGKAVYAVDPMAGERKEIMLTKSPFGFNFVTKVVNLLGNLNAGADASNPFGNLGMMLMMSKSGTDMKEMLPLLLMTGGGNLDMSNPLMLMALMGDGKMGDMWPFLFMMNGNVGQHECHCQGNCGGHQ